MPASATSQSEASPATPTAIAERHGVRVHFLAAYGGFFTLRAGADGPEGLPAEPWRAIARADSLVVDPHKHGLQPYGCGAVLFRAPEVGRFYLHDSPYTCFTSAELHLGEISPECSRACASAAALLLTLQLLPPTADGLGQFLAAGRRAARKWARLIDASEYLTLHQQPEPDIVSHFPNVEPATSTAVDSASARILADRARVLRSVLMKPESEQHVEESHLRVGQRTEAR